MSSTPSRSETANSKRSLGRTLDQTPIRHRVRTREGANCVAEKEVVASIIETPLEFIEVLVHVLRRQVVVRADDAALEQAPDALYGVGMNVAPYPLLSLMVHSVPLGVFVTEADALVSRVLVCVDRG